MKCPLCKSKNIEVLENINTKELIKLYKRNLNIDVSEYFNNKKLIYNRCNNCDLRYFYPLTSGNELLYKQLQVYDWYYLNKKDEYRIVANIIDSYNSVLEIGAGKGSFYSYLTCKNYCGLEINKEVIIEGKRKGIPLLNETIEKHAKNNSEKYDVACSFQVLEHITNIESFINNVKKCVRLGGMLIFIVPSENSFLTIVKNGILNMPPHHVTRWTDRSLSLLAEYYNLEVLDIIHEQLQPFHYEWVKNTLLYCYFDKKKDKLVDYSLRNKILSRLSTIISKRVKSSFINKLGLNGHSVIAVYRKR